MGLLFSKTTPRFVVIGPPNPAGEGAPPPKRLNIVDFIKNERMFSLYVQSLQEMYLAGEDDVCSYFQLASIHGMPYVPWNGHANKKPAGTFGGYCVHRTSLFPTWHRFHTLAFEQVLQDHAARIAEQYTTETVEWRQAAAELRQPFWDWAAFGQAVLPDEIIRLDKLVIRAKPDGQPTEVDNPFLVYKFKTIIPGCAPPFDKWHTTLRHPKNNQSDLEALAAALAANQESLTSQTYFMLTLLSTWPEFSNARADAPGPGGGPATSLEGIHNTIHDLIGGGGHAGDVSVAAFDPVFFMLHANTDRLLSLWAALHPDVWVTEDHQADGTFAYPDNATIDINTPLYPFPNSQDTYWTSQESTDIIRLRYTYPEFDGLDMNDRDALRKGVSEVVTKLYSPWYLAGSFDPIGRPATPTDTTTTPTDTDADSFASILTTWEWSARVRVKQSELSSSFHVLVFLGSVPEDPAQWASAPAYVGAFSAFVNGTAPRCANCVERADTATEGYVHLQGALARNPRVCSSEPADVRPYLADELGWRVQMADGTPVPLERLPSLEVTVVAVRLARLEGEALPVRVGEPVHHHDVTSGRAGGARPVSL